MEGSAPPWPPGSGGPVMNVGCKFALHNNFFHFTKNGTFISKIPKQNLGNPRTQESPKHHFSTANKIVLLIYVFYHQTRVSLNLNWLNLGILQDFNFEFL